MWRAIQNTGLLGLKWLKELLFIGFCITVHLESFWNALLSHTLNFNGNWILVPLFLRVGWGGNRSQRRDLQSWNWCLITEVLSVCQSGQSSRRSRHTCFHRRALQSATVGTRQTITCQHTAWRTQSPCRCITRDRRSCVRCCGGSPGADT